jgi:hypothetical protein
MSDSFGDVVHRRGFRIGNGKYGAESALTADGTWKGWVGIPFPIPQLAARGVLLQMNFEVDLATGALKAISILTEGSYGVLSMNGGVEVNSSGKIDLVANISLEGQRLDSGIGPLGPKSEATVFRMNLGTVEEFQAFLSGASIPTSGTLTPTHQLVTFDRLSDEGYMTTTTEFSFNQVNRMLSSETTTRYYRVDEMDSGPVDVLVHESVEQSPPSFQPLPKGWVPDVRRPIPRCFLAGTPILMADGQEKPIEDIRPGDLVMSFDPSADQGRGALVPKPVSRTFQNITRSIIDLRGLHMTPGHVCLTDDGRFETIAEILLRDGILVEADGTPIRARTGAKIGSMEDIPVLIAYPDEKTGKEIFVRARAGIPCCLVRERDGTMRHLSLALMLRAYHQTLTPDGLIQSPDGSLGEATDWPEDSTPMDEDYRRNWVIQTADGKPYVPEWILEVASEAREEQTVGATLQRIVSPPSQRFVPIAI